MKKSFSERNPLLIGAIGLAITVGLIILGLQFRNLPFVSSKTAYSAYFSEAGGITAGSSVQVSGFEVGRVSSVTLEHEQVLVKFDVSDDVILGDRTEAAIKTKSLLGAKVLEVLPRGQGRLTAPIPVEHTTPAYQLPDTLGDLANTIKSLNTDELSRSLDTLATTFRDTPPDLQIAVTGLARFSQTLDVRDDRLRNLLANANKVTGVLRDRTDQVISLISDSNSLLAELRNESTALDQIAGNLSRLSTQLSGFIADNRSQLRPAVDELNGVLTIVSNRRTQLQTSIKGLNALALSLGEAVSSGPFFNAYLANLLPGQFLQPFIDAAFSDLGLDPNVKAPTDLVDPPNGQVATPPLPVPFPRTGQGGQPRLTIPDAISGNPGDQPCGPPGVPLPGPGCYPYREPPPAPATGGPPPGPPVASPTQPDGPPMTEPTPSPVMPPSTAEPAAGVTP